MSLRSFIIDLCIEAGKSQEYALEIVSLLEFNLYETIESIHQITPESWVAMKIPLRLYHLAQIRLGNAQNLGINFPPLPQNPLNAHQRVNPAYIQTLQMQEVESLHKEAEKEDAEADQLKKSLAENNEVMEIIYEKNMNELQESENELDLKKIPLLDFLKDLEDFDEILDILNLQGEKHGVQFKKGNIQYYPKESKSTTPLPKYKQIICSCKMRNKKKSRNEKIKVPESIEKQKGNEDEDEYKCCCFYRFKINKAGKVTEVVSANENHCGHEFKIKKTELSDEMKKELKFFNKTSKIPEIKSFLENKFHVELGYKIVYKEFRKVFPLLGEDDARFFLKWCQENNYQTMIHIDEEEKYLTKVFITSEIMKFNYKAYGDVILIDSTYRVNKLKLPYILISGFTHTGRNCLFGIGIVNQETQDTFKWIWDKFFQVHQKLPSIIVSDHDLALERVLDTVYKDVKHIICSWHVDQSFAKNFAYLSAMNYGKLKDKVFSLLRLKNPQDYKNTYEDIIKTFEDKKLDRSKNYLESMHRIKHKWAPSHLPWRFTGGVHTTSRIESINSVIKKFVNSTCEIYDFISFLIDFERKNIYQKTIVSKASYEQYTTHPIILSLEQEVSGKIVEQCLEQISLSHNYKIRPLPEESTDDAPIFEATSILARDPNIHKKIQIENGKYICECETFWRGGLICRHVYALAIINQDKNIEKMHIHVRWRPPIIDDPNYQASNDNYAFQTTKVYEFLERHGKKIEQDEEVQNVTEENKEEDNDEGRRFTVNTNVRGRRKKEKRPISVTERNSPKNQETDETGPESRKKVKKTTMANNAKKQSRKNDKNQTAGSPQIETRKSSRNVVKKQSIKD